MSNELTVAAQQMQNAFKDLDATFGVVPGNELEVVREPREVVVQTIMNDAPVGVEERTNDIAVVRETLHRIMGKSEDALDDIMRLARSSEHPRAFEVAGQMIKNVADVASQLIELHKKAKEIDKTSENPRDAALNGGNNIETQNNIVFTGTPQELLEAMKLNREKDMGVVVDG